MNQYLLLVLTLSVISSPAFASRARLESLGEGKSGSFYIDDSRNMFLNPAQIVHYKKKLFLETGVDNVSTPETAVTANRAQGGFTNTAGDLTYGIYMNQTSERSIGTVAAINAFGLPNSFIAPDSAIEAFIAGEGSLGWGFSVFYAGNNTKGTISPATTGVEKTASLFGVRLGVDVSNFQIFTAVGITSKSNIDDGATTNNEIKGKLGLDGGLSYKMDNMTLFGRFTVIGADVNTAVVTELRTGQYGIGAGWKHELTKSTTAYCRTELDYSKSGAAQAANSTTQVYNVPLVFAAESQALSWLTIRGSVSESLLGQAWNGVARNSLAGATTVSLGLGLTFGDVQIDGLVATNGTSNTQTGIPGFGSAPQTNTAFGLGDAMLSRVAVTYNF